MPSIRSTVIPESYKPRTDKNFNNWINYIHGVKPKNTFKNNQEEVMENLLDEAKNHLTLSKR